MLEGKVAFVTGSTRGIGWATAQALASHGANVILHGRSNREALDAALATLRDRYPGVQCDGYLADLSDPQTIEPCFQGIFKTYRRLDVLVNNAGCLYDALIGMIQVERMEQTYAVNVMAATLATQSAARLMARSGGGSIINVTSISGTHGIEGQLVYSGTKAALIGMTKSAAKELAPKQIRVNAVAPGLIDTDMTSHLPPAILRERLNNIKLQRMGKPEDVANAILFLASDLASYITGQVLGVDGGMLI